MVAFNIVVLGSHNRRGVIHRSRIHLASLSLFDSQPILKPTHILESIEYGYDCYLKATCGIAIEMKGFFWNVVVA